jgi:hypothetical protein
MFNLKDHFNSMNAGEREVFAKTAGIPIATLHRQYIYRTRIPRPKRMRSLAFAAGVPVTEIAAFFLQEETS